MNTMVSAAEYNPGFGTYTIGPEDALDIKVSVIREVEQPKRLDLRSRTTVLDALSLSGGFKKSAKRDRVVVLRRSGDGVKRLSFDYDEVTSGGGDEGNFFLQPGDIIVVP